MGAISSNTPRTPFADNLEVFAKLTVSNVHLYEGAFVGIDSNGDLVNLSGTTYPFAGVLMEEIDNSAGSAGAVKAKVKIGGIVEVNVTGVDDDNDINKPVYSANNNDLTTTATSATKVGKVVAWSGSGSLCRVKLNSCLMGSTVDVAQTAALTDSTGGAASDTLASVTTFTPSVAWNGSSVYPSAADATAIAAAITSLKNSAASMAAKVNAILTALKA